MKLRIHSWSLESRYRETPIFFVDLSPLPEETKIALLTEIEGWYGDTENDASFWALEYSLLARMLLNADAIWIHPQCLDLDDELILRITSIMRDSGVSSEVIQRYQEALEIPQAKYERHLLRSDDPSFDLVTSEVGKTEYVVGMTIKGRFNCTVRASSIEEAKEKATLCYGEADFGQLEDCEETLVYAENQDDGQRSYF